MPWLVAPSVTAASPVSTPQRAWIPGPRALHGVDEVEARADRALGVVLVRDRGAPQGHDRVADELLDAAAVALDDVGRELEVGRQELPDRLGVPALGQRREADEVGEQHRDQASLGDGPVDRRGAAPAAGCARAGGRRRPDDGRPALAAEPRGRRVRRAARGARRPRASCRTRRRTCGRARSACRSWGRSSRRDSPHGAQRSASQRPPARSFATRHGSAPGCVPCARSEQRRTAGRSIASAAPISASVAAPPMRSRSAPAASAPIGVRPTDTVLRRGPHAAQQGVGREQRPHGDVGDEDVRVDGARDERGGDHHRHGHPDGDDQQAAAEHRGADEHHQARGAERESRRGHRPEHGAPSANPDSTVPTTAELSPRSIVM